MKALSAAILGFGSGARPSLHGWPEEDAHLRCDARFCIRIASSLVDDAHDIPFIMRPVAKGDRRAQRIVIPEMSDFKIPCSPMPVIFGK
jgi:hypothetical protein